ncbi:MAG: 50S ribosomal protein L4 [Gemmatimonadota bacterium]
MINAPHYSAKGVKQAQAFELPTTLFDGVVNEDVLHLSVKVFLNNQRQGNASTKTRAQVSGGNQKPWKQKGTGRARAGTTRAPHWRGGGVAFGPTPRSYRNDLPKKVRQLARRSALNARAREGMLHVVDGLAMSAPKTQTLLGLLEKLSLEGKKTLILTAGSQPSVYLSARNVPHLNVLPFSDASAYDILHADALVIESAALGTDVATEGAEAEPVATKAPKAKAAPRAKKAAATGEKKPAAKRPRAKKESE